MTFLEELKRRHVYRVAAAYAVVGWLLIQVVTQVFPVFHLPDWIDQAVVLLILVGFPIALVLAWAFDATPHGIVATDAHDAASDPRVRRSSRRAGIAVGAIGVLIALVAGAAYWQFGRHATSPSSQVAETASVSTSSPDAAQRNPGNVAPDSVAGATSSGLRVGSPGAAQRNPGTVAAQPIPAKSVAVLPLVNESGDTDQQYFSDGLSEDLITSLSQFSGLKVINRDSSFRFRDSKDSVQEIGEKLGVAHLLEGSVQRAGDEVRISTELVNCSDGSTLWSQHYDRPYKDLFALQDAITRSVADALKAKLLEGDGAVPQSDRPPSGRLDAYNAYQQGAFYARRADAADQRKAMDFYLQAIKFDPNYALAYASLGFVQNLWADSIVETDADRRLMNAKARANIARALALDPGLSVAHRVHGSLLAYADFDWMHGRDEMQRAVQLAPNDGNALAALGRVDAAVGEVGQGVDSIRRAVSNDPLCDNCYAALDEFLPALGQYDAALEAGRKAVRLNSQNLPAAAQIAYIHAMQGNAAAALQAAQAVPPSNWHGIAMVMAANAGADRAAADRALQALIDKYASVDAYQIAEIYALRRQPDEMFAWLERARANRDRGLGRLLNDPPILRYRHDPRFAALCKKVGLPTTTDAQALP